ncbi:MAG: response regulator transcription factor [Lagierella massiliensis]|nr:response regulator transcription factor [Lagierella massiliensis]
MRTIYLVEDEDNIRDLVVYALNNSNFVAEGFYDATGLMEAVAKKTPDLILLDIMLEGMDGYEILKWLRENDEYKEIPVIMVTAKDEEIDKVRGLDMGADDYVIKPFGVMELISRIKAVLRRYGKTHNDPQDGKIYFRDIEVDLSKRIVKVGGKEIKLTYKEFELLNYLIENKNIVLSRQKLTEEIWGFDYEGETRTIDVHIRTLRQKLDREGYIVTVRNVGYKIVDGD